MKKFILAGVVAAMMLPAAAFAQTAETPAMGTTGAMSGDVTNSVTPTTDLTGNYTIIKRGGAENSTGNAVAGTGGNRNTDPAAIQRTIAANPGLAEKLQSEGVALDSIGALSIEPNGQVIVFGKG